MIHPRPVPTGGAAVGPARAAFPGRRSPGLAVALLTLGFAAGCAGIAARPGTGPGSTAEATPASLTRIVESRRDAIRGIRATGKLRVTVDARRGGEVLRNRFRASQAILVASPASFRLEALSPFGIAYAVASDGNEIAVLIPSEGVLYRGTASRDTVAMATGVVASPEDATALLLGQPPSPALDLRNAWISAPGGDPAPAIAAGRVVPPEILLHATVDGAPGELVVIGFARALAGEDSLEPVLFERLTANGDLVVRARFGGFRTTAAGPIATQIELQAADSEAALTYGELEVNPETTASRFAMPTPPGVRERPLDVPAPATDDPA